MDDLKFQNEKDEGLPKICKLTTNEDIIANVTDLGDGKYLLKNAASILVIPQPTGGSKIALIPFMMYGDTRKGIEMQAIHIMVMIDPVPDMTDNHKQLFNKSSLIVPKAPGLIT